MVEEEARPPSTDAGGREPLAPQWLRALADDLRGCAGASLSRLPAPPPDARPAAVLILLGEGPAGPDVLLTERAETLRQHPGQPAFPGGAADSGDADATATALREAAEETGLDPAGVDVLAVLPQLWIPASGYSVTPVLAWWRAETGVQPGDRLEVAGVRRVPLAELADPSTHVLVRHPSGWVGPGFEVDGWLVWGFTAGLLAKILDVAGLTSRWDDARLRELG